MISKVLHSSRAYPIGSIWDWYQCETLSGSPMLIFVNLTKESFDSLVFLIQKKYFCRYIFPRYSWDVDEIVEYLTENMLPNGTLQKSERTQNAPTQNK